ncbi:MAG: bifunctional phosphoribosylaminoimidazolecarboxamide formyltransferase/IMP cyclohydrolase [Thermoplasmatota archaeon]
MASHALLSVSDKTGIADFARRLAAKGFTIVSTGGTAKTLREAGVAVKDVSDVTGFPEMMDGRVKTMHPRVTGGILARRDRSDDLAAASEHGIPLFDVIAVNLYPFDETVARGAALDAVLENIDIGGPTLIRSAAKNFASVTVVTRPSRYAEVAHEIEENGATSIDLRRELAAEAFAYTARYDTIIDQYFRHHLLKQDFPQQLSLTFEKVQDLRYGENAHQRAAFYRGKPTKEPSVPNSRQLHGKELSYNNIVDVDTALEAVKDFEGPTTVIVKHATPCGLASAPSLAASFDLAYACDTYSPFGGVIATNRRLDLATATAMSKLFLEVIAAPAFDLDALDLLSQKKNVRLLEVPGLDRRGRWGGLQIKSVVGGLVVQDRDILEPRVGDWKVATKREPSSAELKSMLFAFKAVRHIKSNAVVFVKDEHTVAIGGGQTARVDATRIAVAKGGPNIRGSVMASEAFFPFRDGVDEAAKAGVVAIVQPGGSIRDAEVIAAADEHHLAMVFTSQRAFRH